MRILHQKSFLILQLFAVVVVDFRLGHLHPWKKIDNVTTTPYVATSIIIASFNDYVVVYTTITMMMMMMLSWFSKYITQREIDLWDLHD